MMPGPSSNGVGDGAGKRRSGVKGLLAKLKGGKKRSNLVKQVKVAACVSH